MKNLALQVAALSFALAGTAYAADMRLPAKAPAPAPVTAYNWTGCYVGAGGGYGMYNRDRVVTVERATSVSGFSNPLTIITAGNTPVGTVLTSKETFGGHGWLLTGQFGCDLQFGQRWLVGGFVDGDWSNMRGNRSLFGAFTGEERLRSSWAFGGRIGWLPTPSLLAFVSAGYTQAHFDQVNYINGNNTLQVVFGPFVAVNALPGANLQLLSQRYNGFFVGGGTEYALDWLPGLFWKTEYRFADYGTRSTLIGCPGCGPNPTGLAERNNVNTHTVRTELVWRFNFGGPLVARY